MSSFPKKEDRKRCYAARDEYWNCMDLHEGKEEKELHEVCKKVQQLFQSNCPDQWVKHFDRKYKYQKFKQQLADSGVDPVEETVKNTK